ncbi:TonB-dependent receptor plug domain-containing protein [Opitutus sp. ER46]|uniref:TonB-dependent siderophore receptor n=1 Tax=Opitutus sp. ER46 TaxID=2161864 RepID=UPI000D2F570C|nr:TonB-dependent receptor plug domain-containing protein [Opitutus sp. ER46]PTX92307.1 hypothetical protein DB354_13260 [Opitutus sp. ER46]
MATPFQWLFRRKAVGRSAVGRRCIWVTLCLCAAGALYAAEPAKRVFDLPAESADKSLKRFSQQSGMDVLIPTQVAQTVQTNAVRGEMTPKEALESMLARTGFVVIQDPKTQAFSIRREEAKGGKATPAVRPERNSDATSGADETVQMSPFEVNAEADRGYAASSALTGTRTNEKLANLPNTISVFTSDLMSDLAINDFFGAVEYGIGTLNVYNDTGVLGAPVGASASNQVNFRGIPSLRQLRDGFVWFVPQDSFNMERIEFVRGPNGTAYGDVDPSGTLNMSTKRPRAKRSALFETRYDNFGSRRYRTDINVPAGQRLAVRFNAVNSDTEQARQRANAIMRAYAGALRWRPFASGRTQVDVSYEGGNYRRNTAALRLNDGVSAYVRGTGTNALDADPTRSGTQTNGVGMRRIASATGSTHVYFDMNGTLYDMRSTPTTVYRGSALLTTSGVATGSDPQNPLRYPLLPVADDIYPENEDWGGPDNRTDIKYGVYNIEFTHAVNEHLTFLVAHNGQYNDSNTQTMFSGASVMGMNSRTVFIDVNRVLPDPSGSGATIPNPRFEKYFVAHVPVLTLSGAKATGWRTSAVYDSPLPFWNSRLRTVAGATYRRERNYGNSFRYALTKEEMARRGLTGAAATYSNTAVNPIHYLEDGNSDEALAFRQQPGVASYYRQGTSQTRYDQTLGSASLTSLGSFINERVHTSVGVSRYYFRQNRNLAPVTDAFGESQIVDLAGNYLDNPGNYNVPVAPFKRGYTTNQSYGAVVRVLPWFSLSGGYFESALFTESTTTDLAGRPVLPREGEGHEFSARFNLLDDRITAAVTRFESVSENNTLSLSDDAVTELNDLLPDSTKLVGNGDYRDQQSKGWELELQCNLTRQWTLRGAYSMSNVVYARFYPLVRPYLDLARTQAAAQGLNPDQATAITTELLADTEGSVSTVRREAANLVTRYDFGAGRLSGLSLGLAARYELGHTLAAVSVGGVEVLPASRTASNVTWSPFVTYRRKVFGYRASLQVNVNNVFDRRTNQGNSYTWVRYNAGRQIITTASVAF